MIVLKLSSLTLLFLVTLNSFNIIHHILSFYHCLKIWYINFLYIKSYSNYIFKKTTKYESVKKIKKVYKLIESLKLYLPRLHIINTLCPILMNVLLCLQTCSLKESIELILFKEFLLTEILPHIDYNLLDYWFHL